MFNLKVEIPNDYLKSIEDYLSGATYGTLIGCTFKKDLDEYLELDYVIVDFKVYLAKEIEMRVVLYSNKWEIYDVTYTIRNLNDLLGVFVIEDIGFNNVIFKKEKEFDGLHDKLSLSTLEIKSDKVPTFMDYREVIDRYEKYSPEDVKAILLNRDISNKVEFAQMIYLILTNSELFVPSEDYYDKKFINHLNGKLEYYGYDEDYINSSKRLFTKNSEFLLSTYLFKALIVIYEGKKYYTVLNDLKSEFYYYYLELLNTDGYFDLK